MQPRLARRLLPTVFTVATAVALACGAPQEPIGSSPSDGPGDDDSDGDGKKPRDAGSGSKKPDAGGKKPTTDDDESPITRDDKDDGQDEDICDSVNIQAKPNAPKILIVLDRSGSMVGFGTQTPVNRWEPSVNAVKKLTSDLEGVAEFGLMLFPGTSSMGGGVMIPGLGTIPIPGGGGCTPGQVDVPVGSKPDAIAMALDRSRPDTGSTPTASSLENAHGVLTKDVANDTVEAPKFVLLVTDGQPNCGMGAMAGPGAQAPDIDATNAAIDKLLESGIKTYVIGFDIASDPNASSTMQGFAMHGGTDEYIPVENEMQLSDSLRAIAGSLVSCDYELNDDVPDPKFVRVIIDDVAHGLNDGWSIDGRKITLDEEGLCKTIRDGKIHKVQIRRECEPLMVQ